MFNRLKMLHDLVLAGLDKNYVALDYPAALAPVLNVATGAQSTNINPTAVASAASLANQIQAFTSYVSGTNAMTGFRLPRGFRGIFTVIGQAAINGTTGGTLAYGTDAAGNLTEDIPFSVGWVGANNKAQLFISDGAKIYPYVLTAAA